MTVTNWKAAVAVKAPAPVAAAPAVRPMVAKGPATPAKAPAADVREQWLQRATRALTLRFAASGVVVPPDVKVTCGFPGGGSPRKRIGECWPRSRSLAGVNEVFINPTMENPAHVVDVLGHELLHAVDDCKSGHGRAFTKNSKLVGYSGGKVSSARGDVLTFVNMLALELGPYPHRSLVLETKEKKASNGLHGCECNCGNKVYSTAKKLEEYGFPVCGNCGEEMFPGDRGDKKVVQTV
jgi:hypothetical protein